MNALLVLTIGYDLPLVDRLAKSIDHPIEHKLLVNNGKDMLLVEDWVKQNPGWRCLHAPYNRGIAGSWNLAPEFFPNENSYLIVNADAWFNPGQVRHLCTFSDYHIDKHIILADKGYECFVWTRKGVNEAGLFDTNFWPAYYEDYEYNIRLELAGGKVASADTLVNHGKPQCGGMNWDGVMKGCGVFNREYLLRKWGGLQAPLWRTPFNVPDRPIKFWELNRDRRKKMEAIWDTFLSIPNASIYT